MHTYQNSFCDSICFVLFCDLYLPFLGGWGFASVVPEKNQWFPILSTTIEEPNVPTMVFEDGRVYGFSFFPFFEVLIYGFTNMNFGNRNYCPYCVYIFL